MIKKKDKNWVGIGMIVTDTKPNPNIKKKIFEV